MKNWLICSVVVALLIGSDATLFAQGPGFDPPETPTYTPPSIPGFDSSEYPRYTPPPIPKFEPVELPDPPTYTPPDFSSPSFGFEYSCSECNGDVSSTDSKCPHCGVRFDRTEFGSSSVNSRQRRTTSNSNDQAAAVGMLIIGTACVIFLVFIAIVVVAIVLIVKAATKKPTPGFAGQRPPQWNQPMQRPQQGHTQRKPPGF